VSNSRRPGTPLRLGNRARLAAAELARQHHRLAEAQSAVDAANGELVGIQNELRARFQRPIPFDPRLFDVLDHVEIEDGDCWRWLGGRNNRNLPVIRGIVGESHTERSVIRYLALCFGVIGEGDHGSLYPTGALDDVNPWHRRLRRADRPTGNPHRFEAEVTS